MAARTATASALDTTIGTLLTQYAAYKAVSVTGEHPDATANYFLRSLVQRLMTNSELKQAMIQAGFSFAHYKPLGLSEGATPTLAVLDPKA